MTILPLFHTKRLIEQRQAAGGIEHAVLRAGPFMDDWFALIGSALPARGDAAPLIRRRWRHEAGVVRVHPALASGTNRPACEECPG